MAPSPDMSGSARGLRSAWKLICHSIFCFAGMPAEYGRLSGGFNRTSCMSHHQAIVDSLASVLAHEMHIPVGASWHTNVHEFGARRLERILGFLNDGARSAVSKCIENRILDLTLLFYKIAKVLFAPNPELVQMLEGRIGKSCGLMSRGIDTSLFDPARRRREDWKFRIGYVGRLSAEKNLQTFVALERALLADGNREFEIVFVGHGSMTPTLAASLSHGRFTGVLKGESLAREYAGFDAFVFPSRTDTFGNVVLEALASGVPAVVTDAGGPVPGARRRHRVCRYRHR